MSRKKPKDNRIVYVGPTIPGVATRNTTYDGVPEPLKAAIEEAPYLQNLCVPVNGLAAALEEIRKRKGATYTMYQKALAYRR